MPVELNTTPKPPSYDGPFYSMSQNSAFALFESDRTNPNQRREWVLSLSPLERTQHRATRGLVFALLGVESYQEIRDLLADPEKIATIREQGFVRAATVHGLDGELHELEHKLSGYGKIADSVIERMKDTIFSPYTTFLEMTNEVLSTGNPTELMLMAVDERFDTKLRFEAARKLTLMDLAASIDRREGQLDTEVKFGEFINLLDDHVWSKHKKKGASTPTYLLSTHDPETFACMDVQVFTAETGPPTPKNGQKITYLRRRSFESGRMEFDVYVTERRKRIEDQIVKMLRKGREDPAVAVDDNMGLTAVLDSDRDLEIFYRHLMRSMSRSGAIIAIEDLSDTLYGELYHATNVGSSERLRMRKFFAKFKGMRVEIILHTNESFLNERYQRGVSHKEYELNRIFDSGVAELLFPEEFYALNLTGAKKDLVARARKNIEDPTIIG